MQESKPTIVIVVREYHQVMLMLESEEDCRQLKESFCKAIEHNKPREADIVIQGYSEVVSFQFDLLLHGMLASYMIGRCVCLSVCPSVSDKVAFYQSG